MTFVCKPPHRFSEPHIYPPPPYHPPNPAHMMPFLFAASVFSVFFFSSFFVLFISCFILYFRTISYVKQLAVSLYKG